MGVHLVYNYITGNVSCKSLIIHTTNMTHKTDIT